MLGIHSFLARVVAAAAVLTAPAAAFAATSTHASGHKATDAAHVESSSSRKAPCAGAAVEVVAGTESAKLSLTRCDDAAAAAAIDELSILSRPPSVARPSEPIDALVKKHGPELAPGVRRLDERLVDRLRRVVDHFAKDGQTTRVALVSGFRPRGQGSFHSSGRAIDFRIEGVKNEAVIDFCKTLADTGCGYYPNNVFVHMDVRDEGAGHVAWVDSSAPAEAPREAAHVAQAPVAAAQPVPVVANAAPQPRPAPAEAALGLSLAVPVAPVAAVAPPAVAVVPVAPVTTSVAAVAPASKTTELPTLPKTSATPATSEHGEKVSRAHHGRKARPRHHAI